MSFEQSRERRLLLWLCALKIAALAIVFDPAALNAFQLPKSLASRALEWPIAAVVLFALVTHGRGIVPRGRTHIAVLAVFVASAISALFAADRYVAFFGDPENYAGLTLLFDMTVLYLAVAIAVRDERDVRVLLGAMLAAGAVAIAYGAVQALGADPFSWAAEARIRPFATFGNADHFGHFLSVLFGVALGLAVASRATRTRIAAGGTALLTLAMAAVVATRGTVVGIAASVIGAAAVARPSWRTLPWLAGAAAIAVLLALTPLGTRTLSTLGVADRLTLYAIAARATLARPLLGYGPDNFRVAFAAQRTAESVPILGGGPQSTAHDWILDASATTGLVGLAALIALVVLGTLELWRLSRAMPFAGVPFLLGWLAYWGHGLVAAVSLAAAWYPWVALGVAVALRARTAPAPRQRASPRWAAAAVAVVALAGALSGARALQADRDAWSSEVAAHDGDEASAVTFADRAAARDGGRADYWDRLGLALDAAGRRDVAIGAYREATRRAPYEAAYWSNLSRALARGAGSDAAARDDALGAARQATVVDPNAPVGHISLAEIAIAFGRCDLARTEADRAAALEPGHDDLVRRAADCR
ncbi:MAG TPA: O-antigen ligase family protein [Candidatus Acidoferrales bacterium]|nr:O-antigen ligase family protein [Candidatus Acidoferrales bacterium]